MRKVGFLIRLVIIFIIAWTLVWSGMKIWQNYTLKRGYSGFPYTYVRDVSCNEQGCEKEWNYMNLFLDVLIVLAVSSFLTLITYWVSKKVTL